MLYNYFRHVRPCVQVTLEHAESQTQQWADQYQFLCAVSNVAFKQKVVSALDKFNPHYFTVIGANNVFDNINIGHGTYIQHNNVAICNNISIGNHCTICSFVTLSHYATISDYCHMSSYCFVNFATIGVGNVLALRSTVLGNGTTMNIVQTADHSNFMLGSTITKSCDVPGTYFGNRYLSDNTSLNYKIL